MVEGVKKSGEVSSHGFIGLLDENASQRHIYAALGSLQS